VRLINAFVGGETEFQQTLKSTDRGASIPTVSQRELLSQIGPIRLDLIKCDIEGSEFALLAGSSPLFDSARQIAMELHPHAGDVDAAIDQLKRMGFELRVRRRPPTVLVQGRRAATASSTGATGGP
jgi:Methyltransferase FkbM domain